MNKEHEILIQNKIDGTLHASDEEKFQRLIKESDKAKKVYADLLKLNGQLNSDADLIPETDVSEGVMQEINRRKSNKSDKKSALKRILLTNNNWLKYAAVLAIGLIIGSLATLFFVNPGSNVFNGSVVGTIGKTGSYSEYILNNEGTSVKVQQVFSNQLRLLIISTESDYMVTCSIDNAVLSNGNVTPLSGVNTSGFSTETLNNRLLVHSYTNVYQLSTNVKEEFCLEFYCNDQLIGIIDIENK